MSWVFPAIADEVLGARSLKRRIGVMDRVTNDVGIQVVWLRG